jgi:hypothetical protein
LNLKRKHIAPLLIATLCLITAVYGLSLTNLPPVFESHYSIQVEDSRIKLGNYEFHIIDGSSSVLTLTLNNTSTENITAHVELQLLSSNETVYATYNQNISIDPETDKDLVFNIEVGLYVCKGFYIKVREL